MKFKTRSFLIAASMFLTMPIHDICKAIYNEGVKDGKAHIHVVLK